MFRIVSVMLTALSLAACHVHEPILVGPPPIYSAPAYPQAVPPGHGGVPPGLAKKGGVPPGLAKKEYGTVGWRHGPPPWYSHTYYGAGGGYRPPYGIYRDTCYREQLGTALGALAGGATGYQFGRGGGKAAAVIGGTIIGALIGGHIGRSMDQVDQNCVGQILEHAPPGEPITWSDGRDRYEVTPSPAYQDRDGRYCREYQTTATIGGRPQQTYGTACRQPDGSWRLMN